MPDLHLEKAHCQELTHPALLPKGCEAAVLRLDLLHPIVSGNKWFKLRYYIEQALQQQKKRIITFGGAWSNHLLATAYACKQFGLGSAALVRGERPAVLSQTLQQVDSMGMKLFFLSREDYRQKKIPEQLVTDSDYLIDEGGVGELGVQGAATLLDSVDMQRYSHIICAAGTGTTFAGIISAAPQTCSIIGIPVLNDLGTIEQTLHRHVHNKSAKWQLLPNYAWGGYAKHPPALLSFMNAFYEQTKIPTDIVYTSKLFYACLHLVENNFFDPGSRLLIIHSGGLQGNRSLPAATFCFT
jgi:1-aminocyclopropane-1-carboxylate deaminase